MKTQSQTQGFRAGEGRPQLKIRALEKSEGNVFGLELTGIPSDPAPGGQESLYRIEDVFRNHERVRFLLLLKTDAHWSFTDFWSQLRLRPDYYGKIERMAVVGNQKVKKTFEHVSSIVDPKKSFPAEQFFDFNRLEDAWQGVKTP